MSVWVRPAEHLSWWFETVGEGQDLESGSDGTGVKTTTESYDMSSLNHREHLRTSFNHHSGEWSTKKSDLDF